MARPLEDMARDLRPGPVRREARPETAANDNGVPGPHPSSALPPDALAIIEPTPIATNQSGRARCDQWRLRFPARTRPFVDPLTGWTGGSDPLAHVVLRFPSLEAAERYCRLQHLRFEVRRPASRPAHVMPIKPDPFCEQQERSRHA
ncbi:ETC complex I subunit [Sphingomonas sp. MAHUQ-71]|jgi:hypothetical protein|uniref:ETC complex I subunit n=1 Tax=Sphingomonas oryzagri TaxID=3042314 RepID=A0ABT6MYH9_9SPHN|nr:ETC complex I subunit [Sphingomonas oryzagri]